MVTHTNKRQIWILSNEKLHTCNRSYFRGNGMSPTNLPFTGPTWFSTSTTKPGRGSGPGRASPRHVGCAAAILPGGGGAAQSSRCLWAATALPSAGAPGCSGRKSTRALPCECLGHRGPSTAGLDRGMGAKTAHLHRSRRSDSRRAARAVSTRTSEKRASAGGLGDQKETPPPPKGGIFVVSSDINGLFIDPEQLGNMLSMPKQVLSNSSRVVCSTHKSLQDLVPAPTSREVMAC